MEDWQLNIIKNNLFNLLQFTKCDTMLQAFLRQGNVISPEEGENLTALGRNGGPTAQAKEMYDIVMTRTGGFQALIKGLQATTQTGALDTLMAATLVDLPVSISGKIVTVQEILPSFNLSGAKVVLLQDKGLKIELYKVIEDSLPVQLHLDMPKPHKYYIQRYIRCHNLKKTPNSSYISESEFVNQLLPGCDTKGALVCDVPGMGKSLLLENISRELQNKERVAVFFVELSALSRRLDERNILEEEMEPLEFLLCYVLKSKLAVWLLQELRNKQMWRLVFVLDGFVEVGPTIWFLEEIIPINNILLIISSRPQKRQQLENGLQLVAYDILPFTRKEQVGAIVGHWMEKTSHVKTNFTLTEQAKVSVNEFAESCIDAIKIGCERDGPDILGVPLMCHVLSVINEVHAEQLIGGRRTRNLNMNVVKTTTNHLYEGFVEAMWKNAKLSMEDLKDITNFHSFHALKLLFPAVARYYQMAQNLSWPEYGQVEQLGVMSRNAKYEFEFHHQSFAEYFAGKFFAQFFMNITSFDREFAETVVSFFIETVLCCNIEDKELAWMLRRVEVGSCPLHSNLEQLAKNAIKFPSYNVLRCINYFYQSKPDQLRVIVPYNGSKDFNRCKTHLKKNLFAITLMASIENLTSVYALIVQLIKRFFGETERQNLFSLSIRETSSGEGLDNHAVPFLLCWVSKYGKPEFAQLIFDIFDSSEGNYWLKFCQDCTPWAWSPLEVAVITNNLENMEYFSNRVLLAPQRLFATCLLKHGILETSDTNARILTIDRILGVDAISKIPGITYLKPNWRGLNLDSVVSILKTQLKLLRLEISDVNFDILTSYMLKHRIVVKAAEQPSKRLIFKQVLTENTDTEIIKLLFWVFGKWDSDSNSIEKILSTESLTPLTAETILNLIYLEDARETFVDMDIWNAFKNADRVETLQVFTGIHFDLSTRNKDKWNYLHLAVFQGKVHWVEHLIESGHDVNQRNARGVTLMCLVSDGLMEITRLLVEKGACALAVKSDRNKSNVAHWVMRSWKKIKVEQICDWIVYMFERGFGEIWSMRDFNENTPFEILSQQACACHTITQSIRGLLQSKDVKDADMVQIRKCSQELQPEVQEPCTLSTSEITGSFL